MSNLKRCIPDGTRDMIFKDCMIKTFVENTLKNEYSKSGFMEVTSPTIEFYDVFSSENQPIAQEKMYKLFDNQGRILVLRPDMTTPIARITGTKLSDRVFPLKLFYNSNIFRINEKYNGRLNEITQSGVELIGDNSERCDAHIIITAINALIACELSDFKIELGHADFFKGITDNISLTADEVETLRKFVENKNFTSVNEFLYNKENCLEKDERKILNMLPELFGGIEVIDEVKSLVHNEKSLNALDNIVKVYDILKQAGLEKYVSVDLGMVHHINYYTGLIFRGYTSDVGENILSGGRYDSLIEKFGAKLPATGFAIDVDGIAKLLKKYDIDFNHDDKSYLIYYKSNMFKEAYDIAMKFRRAGNCAELSLSEDKNKCIEYARAKKIDRILCIEDGENVEIDDMNGKTIGKMSIKEFENHE